MSSLKILSPNTRSLTLWTEKGAARHAKILDTDQAWDIFEQLEEVYFAVKEKSHLPALPNFADPAEAATAMSTASKYKRKAEKLEALLDESQSFATIKKVQSITGGTYDTYELRRYSKANHLEIQKAEDANYGSVNSYHKDAWLAVYSINISVICGGAA